MLELIPKLATRSLELGTRLNKGPIFVICRVGTTILVYHLVRGVWTAIAADGLLAGLKRVFFRVLRNVPSVRQEIATQMAITSRALEVQVGKLYSGPFILSLPPGGLPSEVILTKLETYMELGEYKQSDQRLSGASYFSDPTVEALYTSVYERTLWTNALHYEVYPGICKMEAEVVRMACALFGDVNSECVGTITSGGTESIILAVKAYRDYAINVTGIRHPEVLVPVTAHAAFNKAAQLLGIRLRTVPVDPVTFAVDIGRMKGLITRSTCMLVGSAPAYPHGCMDDILGIGRLGLRYKIPVHVDACLGGLLLAFKGRAGFGEEAFDFRVPGVSSISVDTHKYGFTPKGSSLLLYRDPAHRRAQYFTEVNWPGGLYCSSTLAGSKCGASIASVWASFLHFGVRGYTETTRAILETSAYIKNETSSIEGLTVLGGPKLSIIAWSSSEFDIYALYDGMNKKGWTLNALQFPPAIHICVSYPQAKAEVATKFVVDMRNCVAELMRPENRTGANDGVASIYGSSQKVPFRELVEETTAIFLDTLYKTEFEA